MQALSRGGHWRHGVENFDALHEIAAQMDSYYKLATEAGPPSRENHLCWGLSGVPEELEYINTVAKTHYFIGGESQAPAPAAAEEEQEDTKVKSIPKRPRSARPYDRVRRPLSPRREFPQSPAQPQNADVKYNTYFQEPVDDDFIPNINDGVTPASSRPISAAARPMSAVGRPKSAAGRSSRPMSAAVVQRPRPSSAAEVTGTTLHVRLPSQSRPCSAPSASQNRSSSAGRKRLWVYEVPSESEAVCCVGFGGKLVPPRRPPPGAWSRKCRENGVEVLRHKLTSCLLMSRALPF